jgi:rhodanese-related sulfurtransferase
MKKILIYTLLFATALILTSCSEGYISSEGASLKKYLSPEKLKELTVKPDPNIWIIDVRPDSSYKSGHIPTAMSYPSSVIMNKLGEISKDKYLIVYCETGGRAQAVIKNLEKSGYTKMMNWGGYTRWPYELEKSK